MLVSDTPRCISGKLNESIQSNSGGSAKESVKVYYRQALGMIRISNHRPDLGPIHPHLTDSIKRFAQRKKMVMPDSTQNWESKSFDIAGRLTSSFFTKQEGKNIYTIAAQALL